MEEVGGDPGALCIAVSTTALTEAKVHPECLAAVERTAKLCEGQGHHVDWDAPVFDEGRYLRAFGAVWTAFAFWTIRDWAEKYNLTPSEEQFEPNTWQMYLSGKRRSSGAYLRAVQDIQRTARQVAAFFESYDLTLTPTLAQPPVPLGNFNWDAGAGTNSSPTWGNIPVSPPSPMAPGNRPCPCPCTGPPTICPWACISWPDMAVKAHCFGCRRS